MAEWVDLVSNVVIHEPLARYGAMLEDRVGPFRLRADLDIVVTDHENEKRIRFRAAGEDRQVGSRLSIDAGMELDESPVGVAITFEGSYSVEGRVATLGSSMITHKADLTLGRFLDRAQTELR
jgi:carbon monoxide dehydrogenase subunit G